MLPVQLLPRYLFGQDCCVILSRGAIARHHNASHLMMVNSIGVLSEKAPEVLLCQEGGVASHLHPGIATHLLAICCKVVVWIAFSLVYDNRGHCHAICIHLGACRECYQHAHCATRWFLGPAFKERLSKHLAQQRTGVGYKGWFYLIELQILMIFGEGLPDRSLLGLHHARLDEYIDNSWVGFVSPSADPRWKQLIHEAYVVLVPDQLLMATRGSVIEAHHGIG
mmetsp:Transcript_8918/g.16016  ORF Transcript_8918/g.16016 Transcript_8918/m.16016 type:complete len:224 (+) Transcript_8918:94-765(+)